MKSVLWSLFTMPLAISLAGSSAASEENRLANTQWVLVSIVEGNTASPPVEGTEVTLEFGGDNTAGGKASCNSYWSSYEAEGDMLSMQYPASTRVGCDGAKGEQELRYFKALESVGAFEITENQLKLVYGDGKGTLVFARGQMDAAVSDSSEEERSCPPPRSVPPDTMCAQVISWVRAPETGVCCYYGNSCQVPDIYPRYSSREDCVRGVHGLNRP
ncbi:META domain-containing protein [Sorangium sp. So ce1151]|uniref:META domain-containing protein n=1 Tax=Sorangium sp. So ce1151 TaxID=3133332 RepID=UPI003F5F481D